MAQTKALSREDRQKRKVIYHDQRLHRPHLVYTHCDPGTGDLLYVGMSFTPYRPFVFSGRNAAHQARLARLLAAGHTKEQIVSVVVRGISFGQAYSVEAQMIQDLRPVYNLGASV